MRWKQDTRKQKRDEHEVTYRLFWEMRNALMGILELTLLHREIYLLTPCVTR
jgi:hypothetical protein